MIDEVFVRIRPEIAGFAAETIAGIRGALTEVNAQVAAAAKANVATAGTEIDANRAVAASYAEVGQAASAQVGAQDAAKAAALEQQAAIDAAVKANISAMAEEVAVNRQVAASAQAAAASEVAGSDRAIAAQKLYAESAVKAGIAVKASAEESSLALGGIKSHLLSLGNLFGVAFGAAIGVDLVKHVVGDAAQVQKSGEVIKATFGASASQVFVGFRDSVAANLGVSAQVADATAAKMGIALQNLHIGGPLAAQMAVGFEKLAGATAMIRGADPTPLFANLDKVVQGNARGLKLLGVTVDTATEKQALFGAKAALITGALTPAQKALAIYRIAMGDLPLRMREAAANSGDLASVQRKLAAEFSNAKDALGTSLLPVFKKYVTELTDWLQKMSKSGRLQHDFNSVARVAKGVIEGIVGAVKAGVAIWNVFSGAVGGAKNAVEILLGVMVASKFAAIGSSVLNLGGSILGIGKAAIGAARTFGIAAGIIEGDSVAAGAIIDSALITTGIGALVVAIGVATAFIVTHWDEVKRYTIALGKVYFDVWLGIQKVIVGAVMYIGANIVKFLIYPMKEFIDVADKATGWIPYIGQGASDAAKAVDGLYNSMAKIGGGGKNLILQGAHDIGNVGTTWSNAIASSASSTESKDKMKTAGGDLGTALGNGVAGATTNLTKPLKPVLDALHNAIQSAQTKIHQTVMDAKNNLVKIGDDLAKTIEQIQAKIGGAAGAIAGSPQGKAFAKLKQLIESGAPSFEIARARAALSSQLQGVGKQQPLIKTELDNLTASFNKGQITYGQFQERLHKILTEDGISMARALKAGGPAFADAMKAQVSALGQQARAIAAVPAKFRGIGGAGGAADIKIVRPLEVIQHEQTKIAAAAQRQRAEQIRYAREIAKYQANLVEQGRQEHRARATTATHAARERVRTAGPVGPAGPYGGSPAGPPEGARGPAFAHLTEIHTGIVRQTAADGVHHRAQLVELHRISGEVGRLGGEFAASEESRVARPLDVLHQDNVRIAATAEHQREAILKATQRTNSEIRALRKFGPTPGFGKYPHGKGSKDARASAKAGNRS